ncbi:MAG: hypothetical protein JW760_14525 [Spirochaetales bacterium]|nr:hypothetical protein [Spirochaetales bacterium]
MILMSAILTGLALLMYAFLTGFLLLYGKKRQLRYLTVYSIGLLIWQIAAFIVHLADSIPTVTLLYFLAVLGHSLAFSFSLPFSASLISEKKHTLSFFLALFSSLFAPVFILLFYEKAFSLTKGSLGFLIPQVNIFIVLSSILPFILLIAAVIRLILSASRCSSLLRKTLFRFYIVSFLLMIMAVLTNATPAQQYSLDILLQLISAYLLIYVVFSYHVLKIRRFMAVVTKMIIFMLGGFTLFALSFLAFQLLFYKTIRGETILPSLFAFLVCLLAASLLRRLGSSHFYPLNSLSGKSRILLLNTFEKKALLYASFEEAVQEILVTGKSLFSSPGSFLLQLELPTPYRSSFFSLDPAGHLITAGDVGLTESDRDLMTGISNPLWTENQEAAPYLETLYKLPWNTPAGLSFLIIPLATIHHRLFLLFLSTQNRRTMLKEDDFMVMDVFRTTASSYLQRIHITRKLEKSLKEKDFLLREVHHRVKNNLQIVYSLLNMQIQGTENTEVISALTDSKNRVMSMASVHNHLYRSDNLSGIQLSSYLQDLLHHLRSEYSDDFRQMDYSLTCAPLEVPLEKTIDLGLIITELVTNAYKYASLKAEESLHITLDIKEAEKNRLELCLKDNGCGFYGKEKLFDRQGFGGQLVKVLVESDLGGTWEIDTRSGIQHTISFHL